ncbi:MAG: L-seryl-tRNA(Sec) selenium transferase [Dehalococcoidia bacterium]|nr:L-seryl-tRNA(Sec) selenium transferase [Dehalococcoidia bacterium]MSQ17313.1 L-seryl-tRNA(Sec) selenium transferase [Dehalococcoidia bacterium]
MAEVALAPASAVYQRTWLVELVRQELDRARQRLRPSGGVPRQGGNAPSAGEVAQAVASELESLTRVAPTPVINATGVIIHTNLGRAPLSRAATQAAVQAAQGYTNLELDLDNGRRGSRQAHLQALLRQLTGAEAALVVNNNAAAVLLGLCALAAGKEVIVSRGEAVEIGGGFRIPDVLSQSGATLVDVGTTNRTYVRDYERAITANTGAFLKAHASNFRVEGFTAAVESKELVELGKQRGIPVLHDVGSGCLLPTEKYGLAHEPTPQEGITAGVGLVFFSGDKLLGGPQAGIVVGQRELVQRLERHPLARAVRIDKLSLASLTATLLHYLKGEAETEIPIWRMISTPADQVRRRARNWSRRLGGNTTVAQCQSAIGGGSLPGETLPSWALVIPTPTRRGDGPEAVLEQLRRCHPPVVARIEADRVLLDPRTVLPEEDAPLLRAVGAVLEGHNDTAGRSS